MKEIKGEGYGERRKIALHWVIGHDDALLT